MRKQGDEGWTSNHSRGRGGAFRGRLVALVLLLFGGTADAQFRIESICLEESRTVAVLGATTTEDLTAFELDIEFDQNLCALIERQSFAKRGALRVDPLDGTRCPAEGAASFIAFDLNYACEEGNDAEPCDPGGVVLPAGDGVIGIWEVSHGPEAQSQLRDAILTLRERRARSGRVSLPTNGATSTLRLVQCAGDCDGNSRVSIGELIRGVSISLGTADLASCRSMDPDASQNVSISELIRAVNIALNGCSAAEECAK